MANIAVIGCVRITVEVGINMGGVSVMTPGPSRQRQRKNASQSFGRVSLTFDLTI